MNRNRIRLLVADDHPVYLEGLCTVISLRAPDLEVVATATNGKEAIERERQFQPDVVLLDIIMPLLSGVEAARRIHERNPEAKVLMLTTFDDRSLIREAIKAGAKGFILKDTPIDDMIQDIRVVSLGNLLLSATVADSLAAGPVDADDSGPGRALRELTSREKEILVLLSEGMGNSMIAERLYISEKTVRNYVSHIYDVTGIHSRTELAVVYSKLREL